MGNRGLVVQLGGWRHGAVRMMTSKELGYWIALLEMHSDDHSLLQGAAGEDAMSVGDVLRIARYAKDSAGRLEQYYKYGKVYPGPGPY
jgi:hypothetical protein